MMNVSDWLLRLTAKKLIGKNLCSIQCKKVLPICLENSSVNSDNCEGMKVGLIDHSPSLSAGQSPATNIHEGISHDTQETES